ncbi:hypothetical protein CIHG_08508 [Coccidioides immitis H538.4]|uniref:Uncharacterized protein n=1 Tax=Coccidioides immitis H538.4 TaxID=396776 RepID=A0A0J8S1K2_COCIT|nr:hypothetical protein CIHG_08508 [Coccidioides immitis H538.4]
MVYAQGDPTVPELNPLLMEGIWLTNRAEHGTATVLRLVVGYICSVEGGRPLSGASRQAVQPVAGREPTADGRGQRQYRPFLGHGRRLLAFGKYQRSSPENGFQGQDHGCFKARPRGSRPITLRIL